MASLDLPDLDLPSPIDELTRFEDDAREMINQLELPGVDGGRAARNLRLVEAYHAFGMRRSLDALKVTHLQRVERQASALGWIRVVGVGLVLLALMVGLAAVAVGAADPLLIPPLAAAFCAGATPQLLQRWNRSAKPEETSPSARAARAATESRAP